MLEGLTAALPALLDPSILGMILAGVAIGMTGGALPGISPSITIALMLPIAFSMDPLISLAKNRIKILSDAFAKLTKDPDYVTDMKKVGLVPSFMDSAATTAYVSRYVANNSAVFALMREKQKKKK